MHIKLNGLFKLIIGRLINDKFVDNPGQQIGNDIAGCSGAGNIYIELSSLDEVLVNKKTNYLLSFL